MRVSIADFIREASSLADQALTEPVTITSEGQPRLVLVSADEYARLRRQSRRAFQSEELSEADIALVAKSEMRGEHASLDGELGDWRA